MARRRKKKQNTGMIILGVLLVLFSLQYLGVLDTQSLLGLDEVSYHDEAYTLIEDFETDRFQDAGTQQRDVSLNIDSTEGESSLSLEKINGTADWVRGWDDDYTLDLTPYERFCIDAYVFNTSQVSHFTMWFGQTGQWTTGNFYQFTELNEGWTEYCVDAADMTQNGAGSFDNVNVLSFEVTDLHVYNTTPRVLIDNLRGLDADGPSCNDGLINGDETEIDRGGELCLIPEIIFHSSSEFDDSLINRWSLDSTIEDSVGDNTGVGINLIEADGRFGDSYYFDGTSSYSVGVPFKTGDDVTISAWINFDRSTTQTHTTVYGNSDWPNEGGIHMGFSGSNNFALQLGDRPGLPNGTQTALVVDGAPIKTGWHHVVGVVDVNDSMKLYFDGELVGTKTTGAPILYYSENATHTIGHAWGNHHWKGNIDEFRIYEGVLTDSQIRSLYQVGDKGISLDTCEDGVLNGDEVIIDKGGAVCPAIESTIYHPEAKVSLVSLDSGWYTHSDGSDIVMTSNLITWNKGGVIVSQHSGVQNNIDLNLLGYDFVEFDFYEPAGAIGAYVDLQLKTRDDTCVYRVYEDDMDHGWNTLRFNLREDIFSYGCDVSNIDKVIFSRRVSDSSAEWTLAQLRNFNFLDLEAASCNDGVLNGDETSVDTGGDLCPAEPPIVIEEEDEGPVPITTRQEEAPLVSSLDTGLIEDINEALASLANPAQQTTDDRTILLIMLGLGGLMVYAVFSKKK